MRIALVFPPFYHPAMYNLPPLGLINLATGLRRAGHEPLIIDLVLAIRIGELPLDAAIYTNAAQRILREEPDAVAFSAQCTTYPPIVQIAGLLKARRPELKIVIGGHNASFLDRQTLERFPCVDAVVRGEGEVTFAELAAAWHAGADSAAVGGVTWRHGGQVVANPERPLLADLNTLPLPDYTLAPPLELYRQACGLPRSIAILEVGRGCPHRCVYCSESALWQRRARTFAVARVVGEMQTLKASHGAACFLLAYDQFTADRAYVEEFCRQVTAADLHHTPWYCISRLDTVDAGLLGQMRAAGCESMCYGIDSGSARTLAFIDKRIDREILFERVRQTSALGMVPTLSFVIGFPEEEAEDIDATLELALWCGLQGNVNPLLQLPTVLPGTELHRRYLGRLVQAVATYFAQGLEFTPQGRLPADESLIAGDAEMFSSFWNLPCPALSLPELNRLAGDFPFLVSLFPKSLLLLGRALGVTPLDLYRDFANFLRESAGDEPLDAPLDAPLCYRAFPHFAAARLKDWPADGRWSHLAEVVSYERHALDVAQFAKGEKAGNIDLQGLDEWRPQRPAQVVVADFRHDLPSIVADLKAGVVRARYPAQASTLVFRQAGSELQVSTVNRFGGDLLALCDGRLALAGIAGQLQASHGAGQEPAAFHAAVREAVDQLAALGLLEMPTHQQPTEGR